MLSLSSKKERNGKVSLKTGIIGIDYKMTISMLMRHLYIAVKYFYITNPLISGDISRVIYKPTKITKRNYFTRALKEKTIQHLQDGVDENECYQKYRIKVVSL